MYFGLSRTFAECPRQTIWSNFQPTKRDRDGSTEVEEGSLGEEEEVEAEEGGEEERDGEDAEELDVQTHSKTRKSEDGQEGRVSEEEGPPAKAPRLSSRAARTPGAGTKPFQCGEPACNFRAPRRRDLGNHMRAEHGAPLLVCSEADCTKEFGSCTGLFHNRA